MPFVQSCLAKRHKKRDSLSDVSLGANGDTEPNKKPSIINSFRTRWVIFFLFFYSINYLIAKHPKEVITTAVFRIEKTRDYTVMSNHHLRNTKLSLKAKGLLSLMLSLPETWDYTTKGLARICKDGVDSICAGVRELEHQGYIVRERIRSPNGQLGAIEYTILEQPRPPERENPVQANPAQEKPEQANPEQLNKDISNTERSSTDISNTDSLPRTISIRKESEEDPNSVIAIYREIILENIEYDHLIDHRGLDAEVLDEIVDLILETVCSARKTMRIAGDEYPAELVKSKFLKLTGDHIEFVIDCLKQNTTQIRNIKKYLLAALFNAPSTMGSYYTAKVNHDMSCGV